MRSLSLHYGTIHIASVAGESRRVSVSGLSKARLLWLFRNFSILEFPVLNRQQQELVYRMWNSGKPIPPKQAPRDVIGRIEAFSPQLCERETSSPKTSPVQLASTKQSFTRQAFGEHISSEQSSGQLCSDKLCSDKPGQSRVRFSLRAGLRGAASWRVFTILLLGAAMYLGPRYLPPKHTRTPPTQVATVTDEKQRARSAPAASDALPPARSSVQPAAPVAARVVAPVSSAVTSPVSAPAIDSNVAPAIAARDLPEAMAHEASLPQARPPQQRSLADGRPQEVLIRVSVDAAGHAQSFHILRGEQEQVWAALKAARLWNFKPCAGGEACDQVLKFTDYGDSSRVQRIE